MSITTESRDAGTLFSDLVETLADGRSRLPEAVHPMADLLELSAEQVLARFKDSQQQDFSAVIKELEDPANPLYRMLHELRDIAARQPGNPFPGNRLFAAGALQDMFLDLHNHVMDHPVWRHPFFVRVFEGRFTQPQLARFALQYFNQIKNTRQCVALSLGRFSGVMASPYGVLNERLSELTQIVLAQLVADEYGVGSHSVEDYPSMGGLFQSTTHIVMYRQLFDGLGIPFEKQDIPMLPEVADNVLTQRLVAGSEAFTPLESLASVGLGMEWGVPEFFSLLLGGMIRFARDHQVPLTQEHLFVFIAHVRYDVLHAIAVMLVTSFYVREARDIEAVKNATNTLMAGRYGMMTGLYHHVFGESCPTLAEIDLDPRYHLRDRRIEDELRRARARVANGTVEHTAAYRSRQETPYVFAAGV
ncbi:MAG: iron-containing redox enzyme family protein [Gammaproteobacteria bacterium]|nr:iron-containing redox enzyme family protein [Gammaproteobacteria bacterium]